MLLASVDPTGCQIYWSKRQTHQSREAGRASLQTFRLAPSHPLQLRVLDLVLSEHIVGMELGSHAYLPKTGPHLIVKLSALIRPTTRQMILAFILLQALTFKQLP